jgi:hypothetical protein
MPSPSSLLKNRWADDFYLFICQCEYIIIETNQGRDEGLFEVWITGSNIKTMDYWNVSLHTKMNI